jgi:Putative zinc-finger
MSDKPANYEFNDELLSAYLDGELSADERAAVEARLATDPAAQQLLHELRSVSQSVQALPTESLGRDLSDDIIRRARVERGSTDMVVGGSPGSVVHGSPDPAPSRDRRSPSTPSSEIPFVDSLPKIRIFNSKRAWIWAAMTLAAGLLIMFVQSRDESANKLPSVAVRNHDEAQIRPTDEAGQPARRELSISAAPKSPSPPPTTIASESDRHEKVDALGGPMPAAPMASEPRDVQSRSTEGAGVAAGPPGAAASAAPKARKEFAKTITQLDDTSAAFTASPEQVATDKRAAAPEPTGNLSGPGGAPGMSAEKQKSESFVSPTAQRLYVVHVVATPDALKKGSFDRLLADNKIEYVSQPAKDQSFSFGGNKLAKRTQSEGEPQEQSNKDAEIHASQTEMVLVEAPAPAIESCLADLNKNANDFVSIDVNEERPSQDRVDAKSTATKSLAESQQNLSRFSRGAAPEAKENTTDVRKYFYSYDFDKPSEPAVNGSPRAGGFGGEAAKISDAPQDATNNQKWDYKKQPAQDIRRARRIETRGIDNRQAGEVAATSGRAAPALPTQSGAESTNQPMSQRRPTAQPEAKADNENNNLKVLFVFVPAETPAASASDNNRPK